MSSENMIEIEITGNDGHRAITERLSTWLMERGFSVNVDFRKGVISASRVVPTVKFRSYTPLPKTIETLDTEKE